MKRLVRKIAPVLLLAMLITALHVTGAGRGESSMKSIATAAERPPIDLAVPAKPETATFALG